MLIKERAVYLGEQVVWREGVQAPFDVHAEHGQVVDISKVRVGDLRT